MAFKLKAPPAPVRCYMQTSALKLECGLSGGLKSIADLWKVKLQSKPAATIRAIQVAMIEYEIKAGNMPRSFMLQARIGVSMPCDPSLKRHENVAKFAELVAAAKLPFKSVERAPKPKVRNGRVVLWFWSKGFSAHIHDRIFFLDGYKLNNAFIPEIYPDVFPDLTSPLTYLICDLKVGGFRG